MPRTLTGFQYRRVAELIRGDMSLIAYHLPLDRHPELGNNALAARDFGLERLEPFALYEGLPIGFKGRFPEPDRPGRAGRPLPRGLRPGAARLLDGPRAVATLGIVSGGAQREVHDAIADGLDAYVTGEVSEWVMNVAREASIHYLAAGHYATERLGIRALGEHLARRFGIEAEFIDVPNPV